MDSTPVIGTAHPVAAATALRRRQQRQQRQRWKLQRQRQEDDESVTFTTFTKQEFDDLSQTLDWVGRKQTAFNLQKQEQMQKLEDWELELNQKQDYLHKQDLELKEGQELNSKLRQDYDQEIASRIRMTDARARYMYEQIQKLKDRELKQIREERARMVHAHARHNMVTWMLLLLYILFCLKQDTHLFCLMRVHTCFLWPFLKIQDSVSRILYPLE